MKPSYFGLVAAAGLLLGALVCPQKQRAQEPNAPELFAKGKKLIEENCSECMGATRYDFERGIEAVRKAIDAGYADRAAAYKLLADAYNVLAIVYARRDPKEQEAIFLLRRQALEKVLELKPDNARIRAEYARALKKPEQEIAAWRDVVASEPNNAEARWYLGVLLVHQGQIDEGMTHLKEMLGLADLYSGQIYARVARGALIDKGRKAEAAEIRRLVEAKKEPFLLSRPTVERLSALQPGNGRMRAELARVVKDAEKQSGQLQNILAGNPTDSRAMFSLAMVLIYSGQFEEGVMYVERVLGSVDSNRQQIYGRIAQNFLIEEGKKAEAAEVAKLMAKKSNPK